MVFLSLPAPDTRVFAESGLILLSTNNPPQTERWAKGLKVDLKLRVEIVPYSPPRSDPQNRLFHALVGEIAKETGMDAELIKQGLKEQYCPKMMVVLGKLDITVPKPTHLLSVSEMRYLIDRTIVEAVEAGVDVSPFLVDYRS